MTKLDLAPGFTPPIDLMTQKIAILARWSNKVTRAEDCWWWTGARRNGYGVMWIDNKTHYAHRVAYELYVGPIAAGLVVCHKCDQPLCVNPAHLFVGTRADNNADMDAKGRRRCVGPRGMAHPRAWLMPDDEAGIRLMAGCGVKQRDIAKAYGCSQNSVFQAIHFQGRFAR